MKRDGLENVHTEKVMVPHWVRGSESAEIIEPARHALVMRGLGNSLGTGPDGVQGEVLVVRSFHELENAAPRVKGKIVFFNVAYTSYEETVTYRTDGPSRAAKSGAVTSHWALHAPSHSTTTSPPVHCAFTSHSAST
jgi:carboxypeptidase Q